MSSPPEWLLWAKKLKDEHQHLRARITDLEAECESLRTANGDLARQQAACPPPDIVAHDPSQEGWDQSRQVHDLKAAVEDATTVDLEEDGDPEQVSATSKTSSALSSQPNDLCTTVRFTMVQGNIGLGEFLAYAQQVHAIREEALVKAFLDGLTSPHHREIISASTTTGSGTASWAVLHTAVSRLIADMEKTRHKKQAPNKFQPRIVP